MPPAVAAHEKTPLKSLASASDNQSDVARNSNSSNRNTTLIGKLVSVRTLYWLVGTSLAVWFLGVHSPPYIRQHANFLQDPMFYLHLLGAFGIYIACIHNTIVTPSVSRSMHVWIGRVGMVLGLVGFAFGAIIALGRYIYIDPVFSVSITIGGVFQLVAQFVGYRAIRRYQRIRTILETDRTLSPSQIEEYRKEKRASLLTHIGNMMGLFFAACGIPAVIRLSRIPTGEDNVTLMILGVCVLNVVSFLHTLSYQQKND